MTPLEESRRSADLVERITALEFFTYGKGQAIQKLTAKEAFHNIYDGLEPLIDYNRETAKILGNRMQDQRSGLKGQRAEKEAELMAQWAESVPAITAIGYTPTSFRIFRAQPRHDLEYALHPDPNKQGSRLRGPNIFFLEDVNNQDALIVRNTMLHDEFVRRMAAKPHGNGANPEWWKSYSVHEGPDIRKQMLDDNRRERQMLLLPEPHLIHALERFYREGDVPRMTPKLRILDIDEEAQEAYFVRPFLAPLKDRPASPERLGTYIGFMHALRLREDSDRQANHYCWEAGNDSAESTVVNIDPDFIFHVRGKKGALQPDTQDFHRELQKMYGASFHTFKQSMDRQARTIRDKHWELGNTLLTYLPEDVSALPEGFDSIRSDANREERERAAEKATTYLANGDPNLQQLNIWG